MIRSVTVGVLGLALASPASAQQKRAITFEDFSSVRAVSDPQPAPDGKTVLYAVRTTDVAANRRTGERFFGQSDADKMDDTVNFLVWRHQADQLGVKLADGDVGEMIKEETRGEFTAQSAEIVDNCIGTRNTKCVLPVRRISSEPIRLLRRKRT